MLKNIVHVIKYANFQFYRVYLTRVIWKKLTIEGNYFDKQLQVFIYIKRCVSLKLRAKKKKIYFYKFTNKSRYLTSA